MNTDENEIFDSIDELTDLTVARFNLSPADDGGFYLLEQSSLQILRELPLDSSITVSNVFSERQRIFQNIEKIRTAKTVKELLGLLLPLVENGSFPCSDFSILINNQIKLQSHDDSEVHLTSSNSKSLNILIRKVLIRQHYDPELIEAIIHNPNFYHKLTRPNIIVSSHVKFEDIIESF